MEEQNDKLEEYLKRSLAAFNEDPSNRVWDELGARLDADNSGRRRWAGIWPWAIAALLFAGSFYGYHHWQLRAHATLETELATMRAERNAVHKQVEELATELSMLSESCASQQSALAADADLRTETIAGLQQEITHLQSAARRSEQKSTELRAQIQKQSLSLAALNDGHQAGALSSFEHQTSIRGDNEYQNNRNLSPNTSAQGVQEATQAAHMTSSVDRLDSISIIKYLPRHFGDEGWPIDTRTTIGNTGGFSLPAVMRIDEIPAHKVTYRHGPSLRGYSLLTSLGNDYTGGYGAGYRQELGLFPGLSVTGTLSFHASEYDVKDEQGISSSTLEAFPGASKIGAGVSAIDVKSKYIDAQLGVLLPLGYGQKRRRMFINPAVAWQIYLPQFFTYTIDDNASLEFHSKRYFGYLGTVFLELGLEHRLKDNQRLQIGINAERSLIPQGAEEQNLSLLGIRASLLFGK